MLLTFIRRSSR